MSRLLSVVAGAVFALAPLTALASPSPSPTLDTVLAPAPGPNFVESTSTSGDEDGPLDAAGYATTFLGSTADTEKELAVDGFVAGYGRTWVSLSANQFLVEEVVTFTGGRGAKSWLETTGLGAKDQPEYQHPDPIEGIDSANGFHFHYPSLKHPYGDEFDFVKGNDYFYVYIGSANDDGAALGATQAKAQFDFAPPYTVPPSQWPEASSSSNVVGRILLLGIVALGVLLSATIRSRRQRQMVASAPAASFQLSPDASYWWDGREWKDINQWIPPNVQRSADGTWWWDGSRWRPVPPLPKLF
jgi:hypothetical protein